MSVPNVKHYFYQCQDEAHGLRVALSLPLNLGALGAGAGSEEVLQLSKKQSRRMTEFSPSFTPNLAWNLEEDKLLLSQDEVKGDLVGAYQLHYRVNPIVYPKRTADIALLKARLVELERDPLRVKMLKYLPEDTIDDFAEWDEEPESPMRLRSADSGANSAAVAAAKRSKKSASRLQALRKGDKHGPDDCILVSKVRQGVESSTSASLRHSMPLVACSWS